MSWQYRGDGNELGGRLEKYDLDTIANHRTIEKQDLLDAEIRKKKIK